MSNLGSRYATLIPLGHGSSGEVYRAYDDVRGETVALKRMKAGDSAHRARFEREAASQSRLDHPHICPVHEQLVDDNGDLLISMRLIEGRTLGEALPDLDLETALEVFVQVCSAIEYAHQQGVFHRDLKPANILLEARNDGIYHAWVVDFGLATHVDDGTLTATGEVLGTPAYMAPEQARGDRDGIGPWTDVFALGCILFEMLAGHPPFSGATIAETIDNLLHRDAPDPRSEREDVPEPLSRITQQCLEHEGRARYATVAELAGDVQAFVKGGSILARRYSFSYRFTRRARRHPRYAAGLLVVLLAISGLVGAVIWSRFDAQERTIAAAAFAEELANLRNTVRVSRLAVPHDNGSTLDDLATRLRVLEGEGMTGLEPQLHLTLAQGWLELEAYEKALEHADLAVELGDTAAARVARVRAFAGLFHRRAAPLRALALQRRQEVLEDATHRWLAPARTELRSLVGGVELPLLAHVRLLVAGDEFVAAEQAVSRYAPIDAADYAASLATGEIALYQGDRARDANQEDAALTFYEAAAEAFRQASTVGRSDSRGYAGTCLAAQRMVRIRAARGAQPPVDLAALDPACRMLETVSSEGRDSLVTRAGALASLAAAGDAVNDGEAARGHLSAGLATIDRALDRYPDELPALDLKARILKRMAALHYDDFKLAQSHFSDAAEVARKLVDRHPSYLPGHLLEAETLRDRGRHSVNFNQDPDVDYAAASLAFSNATALAPHLSVIRIEHALNDIFQFYRSRDRDNEAAVLHAMNAIGRLDEVLLREPDHLDALFEQGANHGDFWYYLVTLPEPYGEVDLERLRMRALDLFAQLRERAPQRPDGYSQPIMMLVSYAESELEKGISADRDLEAALELLDMAGRSGIELSRDLESWVAVVAVRADLVAGRGTAASFKRAWGLLDAADVDRVDLYYHHIFRLELAGLEARQQRLAGEDPRPAIARGKSALTYLDESGRRHASSECPAARLLLEMALALASDERYAQADDADARLSTCFEDSQDYEQRYQVDRNLLDALLDEHSRDDQ